MMLLEYEAKRILRAFSIPVPVGSLVDESTQPSLPAVIKSQVPVGGRGKLGGIVVVQTESEHSNALQELYHRDIKGFTPRSLLAEEVLSIERELYIAIMLERDQAELVLVASKDGGVEVEANDQSKFLRLSLVSPNFDVIGQKLADIYDLPSQAFALADLAEKLYHCIREADATLLEINPLVLTAKDTLVAADCKLVLDQSAAFRHKDWDFETPIVNANFVTLKPYGEVATIANGAGLAMATVDAIEDAGLSVANFLDVGGGANEASVLASFEEIMKYPSVGAIVINIFAGITRCDEIARAIIAARAKIDNLPPLFIRLAGTNSEEANRLLEDASVKHSSSLEECIELVKETIAS